ncbi:MAG: dual specificity protein phosphatase family protein [Planctomycetes bacterium]|nr:dual specificity protein phosphatase family protein [Planctomycetota bacterium]
MRRAWFKRWMKLAGAAALVPVLLAAACYVKWCLCDAKLSTITPGTVYQSAAFEPDELLETCRERGIRTVIDLRDSQVDSVHRNATALAEAGLTHVHLPTETHPTSASVAAFLEVMEQAERPVLVHCQHGEGRSVMMCAIHRIENEGWTNRGAFDGTCRLPDGLRFLTNWFPALRRFRETHPKGRFVLGYVPQRALAPADRHDDNDGARHAATGRDEDAAGGDGAAGDEAGNEQRR